MCSKNPTFFPGFVEGMSSGPIAAEIRERQTMLKAKKLKPDDLYSYVLFLDCLYSDW